MSHHAARLTSALPRRRIRRHFNGTAAKEVLIGAVDPCVVTVSNPVHRNGHGRALPLATRTVWCAIVPRSNAGRGSGGLTPSTPAQVLHKSIGVGTRENHARRGHRARF
jgi:hypothetical protein